MTWLFDLRPPTPDAETRRADLATGGKDGGSRTPEDSSGTDSPLTVTEWAEQMVPHFHAASDLVPGFGGGART
jgi:hypothetical protein